MKRVVLIIWALLCAGAALCVPVDLGETLRSGGVIKAENGSFAIRGKCSTGAGTVFVRVLSSATGRSSVKTVKCDENGAFWVKYPFGSGAAGPAMYFIDASEDRDFSTEKTTEAAVLAYDETGFPELPSGFTNDLLDKRGRTDRRAAEYPVVKALVNSFMNSRGAMLAGAGSAGFDLDNDRDMLKFRNDVALYDFANRDRDWSAPLNNRPCQCFWQSVWPTWFNSSNDHPLDGNPANSDHANYMPYAFANDFSDMLIMYLMRLSQKAKPLDDNLRDMCRQGTKNLMVMQNLSTETLALKDHRGVQENYTRGAFRYGMFVNGGYMTEGKGWFYNPAFLDYAWGGVLNGRCIWALGEVLRNDPDSPDKAAVTAALSNALQFCLCDGYEGGYTKTTSEGNTYWRDAGEHAYLALGLARLPEGVYRRTAYTDENGTEITFRQALKESLNALCDLLKNGKWSQYPNVDSMAVAALAEGCLSLPGEPDSRRWRLCAAEAADYWLSLYVRRSEFKGEVINFGLALTDNEMTYCWGRADEASWKSKGQFFYYQTGHWLHALARLYRVTGNRLYLNRCSRMIAYLLGDNPLKIRLFNETGGVYNWTEDRDGDGIEDTVFNNMYPESTAFCQIGIMHYFDAISEK